MEILLAEGSIDEATSRFAALDPASIDTRNVGFMMLGVGVLVRYYLAIGDARQAQKTAAGYIDALHEAGLRVSLADVYLQQAFALLALDRKAEARRSLDAAREIAVELGNRRILWQILAAQAENATDPDEAARLWRLAAEIVAYLADHAPTQALRASFLARPAVRRVGSMAAAAEGSAE